MAEAAGALLVVKKPNAVAECGVMIVRSSRRSRRRSRPVPVRRRRDGSCRDLAADAPDADGPDDAPDDDGPDGAPAQTGRPMQGFPFPSILLLCSLLFSDLYLLGIPICYLRTEDL
mmetsp:Transcript_28787/g.63399  ORF Transcript_28787/g.63399 Transcript_28787/m.63399 type:complete len:116 (-) Transcript_28787:48-395(-)